MSAQPEAASGPGGGTLDSAAGSADGGGARERQPPPGRPWRGQSPDERREARRQRLLDAALEQFGGCGYASTSLTGLCAAAGVSPRHFYELYPSREQLLVELYDRLVVEAVRAVQQAQVSAPLTVDDQVQAGLSAALSVLASDPRRARVVLLEVVGVSETVGLHRRGVIDAFAAVVHEGYDRLAEAGQVVRRPFRPLALALVGAVNEVLSDWLLTEPRPPLDEALPPLAQVFRAVFRS